MTEKEYTDEEIEELDSFLQFEFYYEIYSKLTEKDSEFFGLFEPLECCQVVSQAVDMIDENKTKPLTVSNHLKKELALLYGEKPLTDEQRHFLYTYFLDYFVNVRIEDEQIEICCSEIVKLRKNLNVTEKKSKTLKVEYAFALAREELKALSSIKVKIAFLINKKSYCEQNASSLNWSSDEVKTFAEKCDLEIKRLKDIQELQQENTILKENSQKHKDLTLDRAVLAMSYLLDELNVKCPLSKKKEFIDFLTPYSPNTIKTKLENLHEKADLKPDKYEEDLQIISKYFENLGLTKIVEQIKRDLEFG